ncbi:MAG: glycosylase [Planctomycetaceae bacterium]
MVFVYGSRSVLIFAILGIASAWQSTVNAHDAPRCDKLETTHCRETESDGKTAADDVISLPEHLTHWKAALKQPVFEGRAGHWDALIRERGWIVRDGETWRLWYTGYNPEVQPVINRLGYATSADGIHWTRHSDQPVLDDVWVEDMMVVRHEKRWLMFAEGLDDQAQLLTSDDGIEWTRIGPLDVRLCSGQPIPPGPYGTPTVFQKDNVWYLFYERRDAGIWLATSTDLKTWTNVSDEPLILPGPDEYDRLMVAMNQIIEIDGTYIAVMHGTGTAQKPRDWCTTFAVSRDLRKWQKYQGNPLLPIADNKSSGQLVFDGQQFRLYTMHARIDLHVPTGNK